MWVALLVVHGVLLLQAAQQFAPAGARNPAEQAAQAVDAANAAQQAAKDAAYTRYMASGADLYSNRKFVEAGHSFEQAVNLKPENDQAQFWAGQALLYARQPTAAIAYLESAQREGGDSAGVHLALAAAYAGAGPSRAADLDRERALLHKWHDEGTHGNITNQSAFLLETFYTRQWHVNVVEYFAPQEGRDILWRFAVRDPAELIESVFTLERPATAPGEKPAAAGAAASQEKSAANVVPGAKPATDSGQEWELISRSRNGNVENPPKRVHTYATLPSYAEVKAEVMKRLRFRIPAQDTPLGK
jgi:tetratricopeptide (TPR) repeat protein